MTEEIGLLQQALYEIKNLTNQNERMSIRLEMFDNMMSLLHAEPARKNKGMSPSLVYEIDKFVESKKD